LVRHVDHIDAGVSVLNIGWLNQDGAGESLGVDNQMSLATLDFLAGIVTGGPPFSVVLTVWLSTIPAVGDSLRTAFERQS
jgi:hypothetical protein